MFKTTKELKEFIVWAKSQGIQQVSVGKVVVVFSPYALAESAIDGLGNAEKTPDEHKDTSKTLIDTSKSTSSDDEDLLYYSAQ